MKILLTGSSGFLGRVLKAVLVSNHDIKTLGRHNADFLFDLCKPIPNFEQPFDLVIHAAGKAHTIPKTDKETQEFYKVNAEGTCNFLKSLEPNKQNIQGFVLISTVAVYGKMIGENISEKASLQATDAYGYSKILAEKIVQEWCNDKKVICTILRLPLIIGKNPPGNLKTMIDGIKCGFYFNVGNGRTKKSMVLAEDIGLFIPKIAKIGGIYNLTDGYHPSFYELSNYIAHKLQKKKPLNISKEIVRSLFKFGDLFSDNFPINSEKYLKITSDLTFDDSKARALGWNPRPVLGNFEVN